MPITKTDGDSDQPFPTLEKCLEDVPEEIGFNVEIKYPLECIVSFNFIFHFFALYASQSLDRGHRVSIFKI